MTVEAYRVKLGWSKAKLAREADIDAGTLADAIAGKDRECFVKRVRL